MPKTDLIVYRAVHHDNNIVNKNIIDNIADIFNPMINPLAKLLPDEPSPEGVFIVTVQYVEK